MSDHNLQTGPRRWFDLRSAKDTEASRHREKFGEMACGGWAMLFIPGPQMALVPKQDYRIVDNWHVTGPGLCGTGSKEVYIENAFVPQHRILQMEDAANGHTAGRELYGTPFYKMPIYTWLTYTLVAPAIGIGARRGGFVRRANARAHRRYQWGPR